MLSATLLLKSQQPTCTEHGVKPEHAERGAGVCRIESCGADKGSKTGKPSPNQIRKGSALKQHTMRIKPQDVWLIDSSFSRFLRNLDALGCK